MENAIMIVYYFSIGFAILFLLINFFDYIFVILGIFHFRKKKDNTKKYLLNKRIAIITAAKNEELVIKHIIKSIINQNYDLNLFKLYVVADNCTDKTAIIAKTFQRKYPNNVLVLERFNDKQKGANFAIQYALKYIKDSNTNYDAYCYFDADNVLDKNWLKEVVAKLEDGYDVVTSYRNSLNFEKNWITASYGIQFIKESNYINKFREKFKMTSWINGTGFCFTNKILKLTNYWDFNSLSHDIEFTQFLALNNIKCGYAENALFYDEQPVKFKDSYKQRLRWSKGFLQVFKLYGGKEFKNFFTFNFFRKKINKKLINKKSIYANFAAIFPQILFLVVNMFFYIAISIMLSLDKSWDENIEFAKIQYYILTPILIFAGLYATFLLFSLTVIIKERKLINCSTRKTILYAFLYPIFMFTYIPISIVAIFKKNISTNPIIRQKRN
ncbi:glycosyltransferase family 2 protein [Mycoplasmoides pirum]|uniref:glycosyltransferase family 2 protein n=1 Tax=Mycoplasmoides pirum TaxID=2122 RepID=UPI00056C85AE|nr:glycosyltransferase family 2 protein [Mycoplasmoides pirum]